MGHNFSKFADLTSQMLYARIQHQAFLVLEKTFKKMLHMLSHLIKEHHKAGQYTPVYHLTRVLHLYTCNSENKKGRDHFAGHVLVAKEHLVWMQQMVEWPEVSGLKEIGIDQRVAQ